MGWYFEEVCHGNTAKYPAKLPGQADLVASLLSQVPRPYSLNHKLQTLDAETLTLNPKTLQP